MTTYIIYNVIAVLLKGFSKIIFSILQRSLGVSIIL